MMTIPMSPIPTVITKTSVPMKNCTAINKPRTIPVGTGRRRRRNRSSSRQAMISGGITSIPSIRWASPRENRTKGENP